MAKTRRRLSRKQAGASRVVTADFTDLGWVSRYRWWALALLIVAVGAVLPGALVAIPELPSGPMFPLRKVEVTGDLRRLDSEKLRARLLSSATGGFFDVNVVQLRELVGDVPWVEGVQITRRWPDQLVITITERKPAARWRSEGLLDHEGKLFIVDTLLEFSALPLLSGPPGSEQRVFDGYQFLRGALMQLPQPINEVELDKRGIWRLRTIDGVLLTFRGDPEKAPLERLLKVYRQQLLTHWDKVRRVDLRYSDGVAVAFAPDTVKVEEGS
ncbi:MAG: hypothetical protein DRQ52_10445 [Gammaproteobacteria bacterium]|nr:MAG: hypothetical protein DRQ52_10445 [Gammaproteobacteria bacterium]